MPNLVNRCPTIDKEQQKVVNFFIFFFLEIIINIIIKLSFIQVTQFPRLLLHSPLRQQYVVPFSAARWRLTRQQCIVHSSAARWRSTHHASSVSSV